MQFDLQKLKRQGIEVKFGKTRLIIQGTERLAPETIDRVQVLGDELGFTSREVDDLLEYICNIRFWSVLKRFAE